MKNDAPELTPKILGDASGLRVIACINKPDNVRVPRMIAGLFIGGALAVSGLLMQAMTRNPLDLNIMHNILMME
jgi:ABC-type enterobactin transport system permease subunit